MSEQALSEAFGLPLCPFECVDIVIQLDVADPVVGDKSIEDAINISSYLGIAEVEVVAAVVDHSLAVAHKEPGVG